MAGDRPRLRSFLRKVEKAAREGKPHDRNLGKLQRQIEGSVQLRAKRAAGLPRPGYPADLPVAAKKEEIAAAIRDHQVVVVCGETGSGKSTQLPKICLELGRGVDGFIGHTQPRRIAARSLAKRIADEMNTSVGQDVGFKIRFTDTTRPETYLKLMTDGILLAETGQDRFLSAYDTLIIDEAHERSLNIDFLLGYLRQLLPKRPDLKVIITSATIDPLRFAEHFTDEKGERAPVIEVSGRTYPVEVRYRPIGGGLEGDEEDREGPATRRGRGDERQEQQAVVAAIDELASEPPGDVLVFLPTERDIRETHRALRFLEQHGTEILPLYSRLSAAEQDKVFRPSGKGGRRRVVLATNVAETSLTVPGIRYVVDTGTARISRYSARSGVQRLPVESISRASADQRKGRCGRVAEGICIRLYGEEDFLGREEFTPPEILRTNLASVILQMKALGLGDIEGFPFVEPPKPATVRDGYRTLFELGAIDDRQELTKIGRRLAPLPVDPRIGRMVLEGDRENCLSETLIIAAALETQDPRLRPIEHQQAADEAHAKFTDERSDFVSFLRLWDFYHDLKSNTSRSAFEKACRQNFLSSARLREWADVHRQLREMVVEIGLKPRRRRPAPTDDGKPDRHIDALHRALLAGLLSRVAMRTSEVEYTGAGGKKLFLWPGSSLFKSKPRWIVAAEVVETTRVYARTVARINPDWIEPLAAHLVTRHHSEPHWQPEQGHVAAFERVSLFGLSIVPKRKVHYGPINPTEAREIFIQHALVEGEYDHAGAGREPPFLRHNRDLIERIEKVEAKARRRDLLADERARFAFYDARVPAHVYDRPSFERFRKQAERGNARLLYMSETHLIAGEAGEVTQQSFPDAIEVGRMRLPLEYHLEPGSEQDGVTVTCPLPALNQLDPHRLEWLVPGLLKEKVTELIRAMPKGMRKAFVPAPNYAQKVVERVRYGQGSLHEAVAAALRDLTSVEVPREVFHDEALPVHLRMNVRVVDAEGQVLAVGRDLGRVREELGAAATATFADLGESDFNRDGLKKWDFGDLPERVEVERGGVPMTGFPAIVDGGEAADLRLLDSPERAERETRKGVRRLIVLELGREIRHQVEALSELGPVTVKLSTVVDAGSVRQQLVELVADRAFLEGVPLPRDGAAFESVLNRGWNRIAETAADVGRRVNLLAEAYQRAALALDDTPRAPGWDYVFRDIQSQLAELVGGRFLCETPWVWLQQYPRYLGGVQTRLQKLRNGGLERDQRAFREFQPRWKAYRERREQHDRQHVNDAQLEHYRWMLEEYRVSLFAQELGTSMPVSAKRLDRQWKKVRG